MIAQSGMIPVVQWRVKQFSLSSPPPDVHSLPSRIKTTRHKGKVRKLPVGDQADGEVAGQEQTSYQGMRLCKSVIKQVSDRGRWQRWRKMDRLLWNIVETRGRHSSITGLNKLWREASWGKSRQFLSQLLFTLPSKKIWHSAFLTFSPMTFISTFTHSTRI